MDTGRYLTSILQPMKPEEIQLWDWQRMLFGETPYSFLIEVIIRIFIIYLLLMVSMRLLGKRMSAQISRNEMIVLVSLAAAIGVPLQTPERGLLPAVIIAIVVVGIGRLVAKIAFKNQSFERITQDNYCTLVSDAVMDLQNMRQTRITPERLFAELRSEGISQLGEVKRLYIEANGSFTLIKEKDPKPGLSVIPPWDHDFVNEQQKQPQQVCKDCGHLRQDQEDASGKCSNCGSEEWDEAVQ